MREGKLSSASSESDRNDRAGSVFLRSHHICDRGEMSQAHQKKSSISAKSVWGNNKGYPKLGNPKEHDHQENLSQCSSEDTSSGFKLHWSVVAHHPTASGNTSNYCPHSPVGGCIRLLIQYLHFVVSWDAFCETAPTVPGVEPTPCLSLFLSVSPHGLSNQLEH